MNVSMKPKRAIKVIWIRHDYHHKSDETSTTSPSTNAKVLQWCILGFRLLSCICSGSCLNYIVSYCQTGKSEYYLQHCHKWIINCVVPSVFDWEERLYSKLSPTHSRTSEDSFHCAVCYNNVQHNDRGTICKKINKMLIFIKYRDI